MAEKEYLCMKKWNDMTFIVMYQLGAFYVAQLIKKNSGLIAFPYPRKYKTVSGASRYLANLSFKNADGSEPELIYKTEKVIREGKYWKGE